MQQFRSGIAFGAGAYLLWGIFPAFFTLITVVGPFEVVPWRVATTLALCAILISVLRRWKQVTVILRSPRRLAWFALASLLLYANWQIYVLGVMTGHVLETSLGYFINPLFTILLGVVFRKERLSRLQWIAVSIATVGVVIAAIAYGAFPWISLGLALSFGLYGAVHKHVGEHVDGLSGLAVETIASLPIAAAQIALVASLSGITAFSFGGGITALVMFSGVMTAAPLILFGEAAGRLPLAYLGFIQFLTPILSFLYGAFISHEELSVVRWIGFVGVWIALVILTVDTVRAVRRAPRVAERTGPIPVD